MKKEIRSKHERKEVCILDDLHEKSLYLKTCLYGDLHAKSLYL